MTESMDEEPWFEIERRLRGDVTGQECELLQERLAEAARRLTRTMDAGLAPAEFKRAQCVRDGLLAGADVVASVWQGYHQRALS